MAKIGNEKLLNPELVDTAHSIGVELDLSIQAISSPESDTIVLRTKTEAREAQIVEHAQLERVESYTKMPVFKIVESRSISERYITEKPKKKESEVTDEHKTY